MASITEQLSNAKSLLNNFTDDFEEELGENAPSIDSSTSDDEEVEEPVIKTEVISNEINEDPSFTQVGKGGKPIKRSASVTPLFTEKVKNGLKESSFGKKVTVTAEPEEAITFGPVIDKKDFDKSKGKKPNYMLNPVLFQTGIKELSKELGVNVYPEIDLFADEFNKQPGVKEYFHYNPMKKSDSNYDAFTQDWSIYKFVYANFFWGKMHDVILKAKHSKVNLITFLDLSENASSFEYYKLHKENCRVQYNFSNVEDLWVHASTQNGYQKFSTSHLPSGVGKYSLCFFNFHDEKIETAFKKPVVTTPEVNGRLTKKISANIKNPDGERISAHQNENGTVTLTRVVNEAINTSHESIESGENTIKTLEFEIETIIKSKNLEDEKILFQKKKEQFENELKKYQTYLERFKELL
jgi:hypothetical protein